MKSLKNVFTISSLLVVIIITQFTGLKPAFASRLCGVANSTIYYVDVDSTSGSPDGCSWGTAYRNLQDALADSTLALGDEIWVAAGTYYPDLGAGQTNDDRDSTFTLEHGVDVYGGFAGTETLLSQRNPAVNVTILSGDIGTLGDDTDNAYHVVTALNINAAITVLDGVTIRDGYVEVGSDFGGGMYISNSNNALQITGVTLRDNFAGNGGGLATFESSPVLTRVIFSTNSARQYGGGFYNQDGSPVLVDVIFDNNETQQPASPGGGMHSTNNNPLVYTVVPSLTNVTFSNNRALQGGGGGMFNFESHAILTNVTFSGNSAFVRGGAMLNEGSNPVLNNVTMSGNTAPAGTGGAMRNIYALGVTPSNPVIRNTILWGNGSEEIVNDAGNGVTITDSVVQGGTASVVNNIIVTNPNLGALANNGGFTQTRAIGIGSSALDAGGVVNTCASDDQRDVTRPQGIACDIGAFEFGGTATTTSAGNASATYGDTSVNLTATVTPNPGGGTVQFYVDGNPVGSATVNAGSGIATFSYNPSALNAGPHPIRADFAGSGSFLPSSSNPAANGTLTINQKAASVTPDNASKIYGDADPAPLTTGTLTGFLPADNITAIYSRAAGEIVAGSPYTISAILSPAGVLANYNITYNTADFTITQRPASVTPNDASKVYGDADPAPLTTGTLTGFLPADNVTAIYSRVAGETVAGGPYTISATLSPAGVLANYNITYNTADFTINQLTVSVTPNPATKVYGDADPVLTGTLTGFLPADNVTATYTRVAGETVSGGPYTISATLSPAGVLANYNITYNTANFTITQRPASVTPNNASKAYGDADPIPLTTGTLTGFLPADGVTATYTRTAGETAGPYTISATLNPAGVLGNYNITYNTATFTITGILVTPSITASDKTYDGTTTATFTCSLSGVIGTDDVTCTGGTATFADRNVGMGKLVTATGLTLGGADASNYTISPTSATDTADINLLAITVTAATDTKVYDGTITSSGVPTITLGALGTGDTATWTQAFNTKHVGINKTLIPSGTVSDGNGGANYTVTFANNTTGEITQRPITVTAVTDTKVYDGTTSSTGLPTITTGTLGTGDTATWTQTFDTPLVGTGKTLTPAGTVNDGNGGNNYAVTFAQDFTGVITGIPLTVTINQAVGQIDPTNGSTINFTVVFSASVSNFATGDVTLSGGAGATTAVVTGSGTTYNIAVSGMAVDGTVIADIPAGVASDIAGNVNLPSTSTDNTVTYDTAGPTVTINQAGTQTDPTNASPINFTVVFGEVVSNFATGDVSFTGSTATGTLVGTVTGGPTTYNVAVSGMTGNGTVIATINGGVATDSAGNGNAASTSTDNTVTYDTTGPIVTIGVPVPASTTTGPVDFNVSIAGGITFNLLPTNVTLNTTGTATGTVTVTNGNTANPTVTISGITGSGTISISIAAGIASDGAGNNSLAAGPSAPVLVDNAGPIVLFNANTVPTDGATLSGGPTQLRVAFNEDVKNDGSAGAANNVANYLLVENGTNLTLDTVSCVAGPSTNDVQYAINSAVYTNNGGSGPFVATLGINGGTPLPVGTYHLFVCGTTSIEDLTNNELNNGAADTVIDFTVVQAVAIVPKTGFAMNMVTTLPAQPEGLAYASTDMWVEIPGLGVKMSVVGVPKTSTGWDVTWLDQQAGWLDGSAYPTWSGNSVITAHVWDALNKPGPFARLKDLKYGDQVKIHAFGQVYTYEIRETTTISPANTTAMLKHQEKAWLTLITCEGFQELTKNYSSRRMVRAVLVSVTAEK